MTDPINAAEPTPAGTSSAAPATSTQPDYKSLLETAQQEAATWKSRFTGLQTKYQQEQTRWTDDSAKAMDLGEQLKKLTGDHEALKMQFGAINEKHSSAQTEAETLKSQLERLNIVTKEFPNLVPFLQDDLIPDAAGDELRTKLRAFSERLGNLQAAKLDEKLKGTSLPNPPEGVKNDAKSLLKQAMDALRSGNNAEYDKLYSQYLDALKNQGG